MTLAPWSPHIEIAGAAGTVAPAAGLPLTLRFERSGTLAAAAALARR